MSYPTWLNLCAMQMKRMAGLLVVLSMLMLQACGGGGSGNSGGSGGGSGVGGGTFSANCYTISAYTNPEMLFSFADFKTAISDCSTIGLQQLKLNYTYFAGKTFHSQANVNDVFTYDNPGTEPSSSSPATGTYTNSVNSTNIPFTWYIEVDGSNTYLVINSNDKTIRLTSVYYLQSGTPGTNGVQYSTRTYYENSVTLGSDMNRAVGSDSEINDDVMTQDANGGVAIATCNGFDPNALYSFNDFQLVIANCGTAEKFNYSYFAGKTFTSSNAVTFAFDNATSSPTAASPATGTYTGTSAVSFTWYMEDAGTYTDVVIKANDGTQDIRITFAVIAQTGTPGVDGVIYDARGYQESSNDSAVIPMVRSTGVDGHIGSVSFTQSAGGSANTLTCNTASTYDPVTDFPQTFFTFADYETVVNTCGTAMTFDHTMFDGKTYDVGGTLMTFNADGTGTTDDPNVNSFTWSVETATAGYSYLVTNYSCTNSTQCGSLTFRDTIAFIAVTGTPGVAGATYDPRWYSEASNYPGSDMVTATGQDGVINNTDKFILQ